MCSFEHGETFNRLDVLRCCASAQHDCGRTCTALQHTQDACKCRGLPASLLLSTPRQAHRSPEPLSPSPSWPPTPAAFASPPQRAACRPWPGGTGSAPSLLLATACPCRSQEVLQHAHALYFTDQRQNACRADGFRLSPCKVLQGVSARQSGGIGTGSFLIAACHHDPQNAMQKTSWPCRLRKRCCPSAGAAVCALLLDARLLHQFFVVRQWRAAY